MKGINQRETMTEREREEFEQQVSFAKLQGDYQLLYKNRELDLQRIETRWTQLFRLPVAIIMLPVRLILAIAYMAHAIRGTKPDDKFWEYLRSF